MTSAVARGLAALLIGLSALTGCEMPSSNAADLNRVANDMLDMAELALPAIADDLGATLIKGVSGATREGGSEGSTPRVTFRVRAWMDAPELTRAALEQALAGTGFTDLAPPEDGRPSDVPSASGVSADGTTLISLTYSAISNDGANLPYPTLHVTFSNIKPLRVSNGTFETFSRDFDREFDQRLVHEAPALAALRQQADLMLDDTEAVLPVIARAIGANLTMARFTMWDSNADNAQASVKFVIEGSMTCPSLTQEALEYALVASGYSDIEPYDDATPHRFTSARAISKDGTRQIDIYYAVPGGPKDAVEIYVSNVTDFNMSDSSWKAFKPTFTRDFDQNLVDSPTS